MTGSPIVTKIEKLLRLSRDQDGTPEGETAARLASRMMVAHAIEMADIDVDKRAAQDPLETQKVNIPTSVWRRLLAHAIAIHCNCSTSYRSWRGRGSQQITIYGHRSDIEIAKYLYTICERQIEKAAKAYIDAANTWLSRGEKRRMGNDFRRCAVSGLSAKLREIRVGTKDDNPDGFALVVTRKSKVNEWVKTFNLRNGRSSTYGFNQSGYAAGQNVSLNAGVDGSQVSTRKRLTGRR